MKLPRQLREPNFVTNPENDRQRFQYLGKIVIECDRLAFGRNMNLVREGCRSIGSCAF